PRLAPRLQVPRPIRLPPGPLRIDPPGPDRQAPRVCSRPRDADLVAHLRLPLRDPRGELRPEPLEPPVHRLRRGDAPPGRSNLGDALGRPLSSLRLEFSPGVPGRGTLDCDAPPRPTRPGGRDRWRRDSRPLRVAEALGILASLARVRTPRDPARRRAESGMNGATRPSGLGYSSAPRKARARDLNRLSTEKKAGLSVFGSARILQVVTAPAAVAGATGRAGPSGPLGRNKG